MAVFRTLKSLIRNPNPRSRLYFCGSDSHLRIHAPPYSPSAAAASIAGLHLTSSLSGLRRSGPLFLSSPAWKLLQSATPLYFRGRPPAFPSDRLRARSFPIKLGFGAAADIRRGSPDVVRWPTQAPISGGPQFEAPVADRFLNLPNLVSISRMVSGPFIGWVIINEWYLPAFCGLVISGATDWLDGFLARKMNINSVFGSYLDPLADKVLIGCVALAMVEKDLLHPGLVGLVVLRDVALVGGAIYKRASSLGWKWKSWSDFMNLDATHRERMEPLFISKINTVLQLLLVAAALLQPEFGVEDTQLYITYLSWLVASTTVASAAGYGIQHFRYR